MRPSYIQCQLLGKNVNAWKNSDYEGYSIVCTASFKRVFASNKKVHIMPFASSIWRRNVAVRALKPSAGAQPGSSPAATVPGLDGWVLDSSEGLLVADCRRHAGPQLLARPATRRVQEKPGCMYACIGSASDRRGGWWARLVSAAPSVSWFDEV